MWPWKRLRRYPGEAETLLKYIYLSDSEATYRLATSTPLTPKRLDQYYAQVAILHAERRKAFTFYGITFAASVLAAFNGIQEASADGITVSSDFLKHAALVIWPLTQCRLGLIEAKYNFIGGIFNQRVSRLPAVEKVDFLARYPLAISFHEYYVERIGSPPFLIRMRLPLRLIAFVVLTVVGLLAYVAFAIWIYLKLVIFVIEAPGIVPAFWSWCVVVASAAMMLFSYALPATSFFRKRYTHMGLVTLMNSLMNRNRNRYAHFVRLIYNAANSDRMLR